MCFPGRSWKEWQMVMIHFVLLTTKDRSTSHFGCLVHHAYLKKRYVSIKSSSPERTDHNTTFPLPCLVRSELLPWLWFSLRKLCGFLQTEASQPCNCIRILAANPSVWTPRQIVQKLQTRTAIWCWKWAPREFIPSASVFCKGSPMETLMF